MHYNMKKYLLIAVTILLGLAPVKAASDKPATRAEEKVKIGDLYYYLDPIANTATVTSSLEREGNGDNNYPGLESISVPDYVSDANYRYYNVEAVDDEAFANCPNLKSLFLPDNIESIGYQAFAYSPSLEDVHLPSNLESLPEEAFRYCTGLQSITLPNYLKNIGPECFEYCTSLQTVNLPYTLETIQNGAFRGCSMLTSVTLPNNLRTLGFWVFEECDNLKTLNLLSYNIISFDTDEFYDQPDITDYFDENTFLNCDLCVVDYYIDVYKETYPWSEFRNIYEYSNLTSLNISVDSVTMKEGETFQIPYNYTTSDDYDPNLNWTSSDTSIAEVTGYGYVYAYNPGTVTITVSKGKFSASCIVNVLPYNSDNPDTSETKVTLDITEATIMVNQTLQLQATVTNGVNGLYFEWDSSNYEVAWVEAGGLVHAVSPGYAEITVRYGEAYDTCYIEVIDRSVTPSELLRKGNGTSCTFIVMMPESINSDEYKNYLYVYGYTDLYGNEYVLSRTPLRYCQTNYYIYNDYYNDFWVYAISNNGNGNASQRRHLNGNVDEPSKGTRPGDTRHVGDGEGDTTAIYSIIDGGKPAVVTVFSASGQIVATENVAEASQIQAFINYLHLKKGVYVISINQDGAVETKKILIK